ncbi:MAG: hypothetical protein AAF958_07495 [Planctomycetota bacterium]
MSRRRRPTLAPSLFPFLAVLVCTLGTLILMLALVSQNAAAEKLVREDPSSDELSDPPPVAKDVAERWGREAEFQIDELESLRDAQTADAERRRDEITVQEREIRKLREQLASLNRQVELASNDQANLHVDEAALQRLEAEIAAQAEALEQAREEIEGAPPKVVIVPHAGPNGTSRRAIYLVCDADGLKIEPEGVRVSGQQLARSREDANPLDAALRVARLHALEKYGDQTSPYPLLVVRPGGIETYYRARGALEQWDDQFGYELVPEDVDLAFPDSDPVLKQAMQEVIAETSRRQVNAPALARGNGFGSGGPQRNRMPRPSAGRDASGVSGQPINDALARATFTADPNAIGSGAIGSGIDGDGLGSNGNWGPNSGSYDGPANALGGGPVNASGGEAASVSGGETPYVISAADLTRRGRQRGYRDSTLGRASRSWRHDVDPRLTGPRGQSRSNILSSDETGEGWREQKWIDQDVQLDESLRRELGLPADDLPTDDLIAGDSSSRDSSGADSIPDGPRIGDSKEGDLANPGSGGVDAGGEFGQNRDLAENSDSRESRNSGAEGGMSSKWSSASRTAASGSPNGSGAGAPPSSGPPSASGASGSRMGDPGNQILDQRDWGLPENVAGAGGNTLVRKIRIEVMPDRLLWHPGRQRPPRTYMIVANDVTGTTDLTGASARLAGDVRQMIRRWGPATAAGRWEPVLRFEVHPGADERYLEFRRLMSRSGLRSEAVRVGSATAKSPVTNTGGGRSR